MAAEKKSAGAEAAAAQQPKVIWDDSNMRSVYSNATNVAAGREEIVLLFGMNQAWHAGQKEIRIQLAERIILNPFAAKRLSVLLNSVLHNYEARYGKLEVDASPAPASSVQ
ncbi:MAG: DUF3467 domain-containing protein [Desulfobacteraceae bacterium]|nr:MAG: DUF3467 domain-containing protein [Desulfobacteraceae bacterium]